MLTRKELKMLRARDVQVTPQYLSSDDGMKASKEGADKAIKQADRNYRS